MEKGGQRRNKYCWEYTKVSRVAGEAGAEAIFMGVHGRNVIDRMLFGSTTHHVIRQAPCPC
jgi:nucleotide-binding universal stress UspA family protein